MKSPLPLFVALVLSPSALAEPLDVHDLTMLSADNERGDFSHDVIVKIPVSGKITPSALPFLTQRAEENLKPHFSALLIAPWPSPSAATGKTGRNFQPAQPPAQ